MSINNIYNRDTYIDICIKREVEKSEHLILHKERNKMRAHALFGSTLDSQYNTRFFFLYMFIYLFGGKEHE